MSLKKLSIRIASILLTIVCAIFLIKIPSGSENPFLFGFSLQRTLLLFGFFILLVAQSLVFFFLKEENTPVWLKRWMKIIQENKACLFGVAAVLLVSWYFTFLPIDRFSGNQAIFTRIKPAIIWIFAQTALWFCTWLFRQEGSGLQKFKFDKNEIIQGRFFILLAIGVWLLVARTKFGLTSDTFWDNLGVPITITQVALAFIFTLIIFTIFRKYSAKLKHIEIYLFFLLWIIAAVVWISEPQHTSTFNPGPFLPNNEFYPNSDAQVYDTCALSPMLGLKYCYFNDNAVSKPFYTAFLLFLHLFSGNNYTLLINLQVVFIALLPPILFLIGKQLYSHLVGILAAIFSIIKIYNSIADSLVIWTVSNPKFMMSESFLAVFLAILCLFMIIWYQNPGQKRIYLYLSGVTLGLCTLIRDNVWILVPVFVLVIFFRSNGNGWKKLWRSVLFTLIMILAITPWTYRNVSLDLTPITSLDSLKYVVLGNRYGIEDVEFSGVINNENTTSDPIIQEEIISEDITENSDADETEPDPDKPVLKENDNKGTSQDLQVQNSTILGNSNIQQIINILSSTGNHFFHNILSVFFTLPISYQTGSVEDTITKTWEINPWTRTWDGTLNLDAQIFMALNIVILCMGIISLYRKSKTAYFIPLLIMISYLLGIGFAKTSGGRYIVPVDWILLIFYAAGLLFIMEALGIQGKIKNAIGYENDSVDETKGYSNKMATALLAVFLGIGILIPISENIFPEKYFPQTYGEFLNELEQKGYKIGQDYFSSAEAEKFLEEENAVFVAGQGLYPKVLKPADENASEFFNDYLHEPYTLLFTLLNEKEKIFIYLPISTDQINFSHGATVYILGCEEGSDSIRGLTIVILDQNVEIINSENLDSLRCKK